MSLYHGPAPRDLPGEWVIICKFEWPDGRAGVEWLPGRTHAEAEMERREFGYGWPLHVSDGSQMQECRVTSALLMQVQP